MAVLGDLELSDEVRGAMLAGRPVVALESSIIAHGFPAPDNLALGREIEAAVRAAGAVPATVALADGRVRVGIDAALLERLASDAAVKCSARDLPVVLAQGRLGATTVAATALVAERAGIAVFATGGIGGVHRRFDAAEHGPDISADLSELARRAIVVVSAGAKSILDLPATLEALETLGVTVVGYRCDEFPAFHARESGLGLTHRVEDAVAVARAYRAARQLGTSGALLVCNPPPADQAMSMVEIAGMIEVALRDAAEAGVVGGAVTPFLLRSLDRQSGGRTRRVNRALAIANARLGAEIAAAIAAARN